jgi:Asp-tRNA(Asn)/Glu-tRNA(Gln) amidotransferase A subunit family amidase
MTEIAARAGGDPGFSGFSAPCELKETRPRRVASLQPAGWDEASPSARQLFATARARIEAAGIEILTAQTNPTLAGVEATLRNAMKVSRRINAWESRWPLNTYCQTNPDDLSRAMLNRLAEAEAMTIDDYRILLDERARSRALYSELAAWCDASITLSASGVAPEGLSWTGDPTLAVPSSFLGAPAVSLPLLRDNGMPIGLQVIGYAKADTSLCSIAAWLEGLFSK